MRQRRERLCHRRDVLLGDLRRWHLRCLRRGGTPSGFGSRCCSGSRVGGAGISTLPASAPLEERPNDGSR